MIGRCWPIMFLGHWPWLSIMSILECSDVFSISHCVTTKSKCLTLFMNLNIRRSYNKGNCDVEICQADFQISQQLRISKPQTFCLQDFMRSYDKLLYLILNGLQEFYPRPSMGHRVLWYHALSVRPSVHPFPPHYHSAAHNIQRIIFKFGTAIDLCLNMDPVHYGVFIFIFVGSSGTLKFYKYTDRLASRTRLAKNSSPLDAIFFSFLDILIYWRT